MIRQLAWLWRTRNCQHPNVRGIYGDEIIHSGWRRWRCLDCGKAFNREAGG